MCKIMMFSGIKPEKVNLAWQFAEVASQKMTSGSDRDGFGYAAITPLGEIFGERWLKVADAFKNRHPITPIEEEMLNASGNGFYRPSPYNSFGSLENKNDVCAITLHARLSTNEVTLLNTHPHVYPGGNTALIHNGVIRNAGYGKQITLDRSTCDSEAILDQYVAWGIDEDPSNMEYVAKMLDGYYACAVLSTLPDGTPYMDVFKDNGAALCVAYVPELGAWVYTTAIGTLQDVCRDLRLECQYIMFVKPGHLMRHNAETGKIIKYQMFDPKYDFTFAKDATTEVKVNAEGDTEETVRTTDNLSAVSKGHNMQQVCGWVGANDKDFRDEEIEADEVERRILRMARGR